MHIFVDAHTDTDTDTDTDTPSFSPPTPTPLGRGRRQLAGARAVLDGVGACTALWAFKCPKTSRNREMSEAGSGPRATH